MPTDKRQSSPPRERTRNQPQAVQGDPFVKHLEQASSVVRTWPAWKQELLGGTSSPAQMDCSAKKRSS